MRIEALLQFAPGCFVVEQLADPRYPANVGKARCVGGKQEEGETPADTIVRELKEEYGITIQSQQVREEIDLQCLSLVPYARRFVVTVDRDIIGRSSVEGDGTTLIAMYNTTPEPWDRAA